MSVTFCVPGTGLDLNVSNRSAGLILFGLLGYDRADVALWGDLDPADVLRRLATSEYKIPALVEPTRESRGVYMDENGVGEGCLVLDFGYDAERIMRYVTQLQIMADLAAQLGKEISYG